MRPTRIILAVLFLSITAGCFAVAPIQPVKVRGTAMLPTLKDGDRILIERNPKQLARGDIVVFYYPHDTRGSMIKRIVGLPGETIEIRETQVVLNGQVLAEPYIDPKNQFSRSQPPEKVPDDSYYVMGDNRENSNDSRIWGPLHRKFIYGKYMGKYFDAK